MYIRKTTTYTLVDKDIRLAEWYDEPEKTEITLEEATEIMMHKSMRGDMGKFLNMHGKELSDEVLFEIWKSQL